MKKEVWKLRKKLADAEIKRAEENFLIRPQISQKIEIAYWKDIQKLNKKYA